MNRKASSVLSVLLSLIMTVGLLPVSAFAGGNNPAMSGYGDSSNRMPATLAVNPTDRNTVMEGNGITVQRNAEDPLLRLRGGNANHANQIYRQTPLIPTEIKLTLRDRKTGEQVDSLEVYQEYIIEITLTEKDAPDRPLADRAVSSVVGDRERTNITDSRGQIEIEGIFYTSGERKATSLFQPWPGDAYAGCTAEITIPVNRIKTGLTVGTDRKEYAPGETVIVSGKLTHSGTVGQYDPFPGAMDERAVSLRINDAEVQTPSPIRTDKKGEFSYTFTAGAPGNYSVKAGFAQDEVYQSCSAETSFDVVPIGTVEVDIFPIHVSEGDVIQISSKTPDVYIKCDIDPNEAHLMTGDPLGDTCLTYMIDVSGCVLEWQFELISQKYEFSDSLTVTGNGRPPVKAVVDANDKKKAKVTYRIVVGQKADLGISITPTDVRLKQGETKTFDVLVKNDGPDQAIDSYVKFTIPDGLTCVSDTANGKFDPDTGFWVVGDLAAGGKAGMTVTIRADAPEAEIALNVEALSSTSKPDPQKAVAAAAIRIEPFQLGSLVLPEGGGRVVFRKGSAEVTTAHAGDALTVSWEPENGYVRDNFLLMDKSGPVSILPLDQGSPVKAWSFTMPASDVSATARFTRAAEIVFSSGDGSSDTCDTASAYELRFALKDISSAIGTDYRTKIRCEMNGSPVVSPDLRFADGEYVWTVTGAPNAYALTVIFDGDDVYAPCRGEFLLRIAVLTGISLDSQSARKEYFTGEGLDVSGLVLTEKYDDNSTRTVIVTPDMVSGFDSSRPGRQKLTVICKGFTATYEIEVREKPDPAGAVTGIRLNSDSTRKVYTLGETLDVNGLTLTVSRSDGSRETVSVTPAMVSGFDSSRTGKLTLTVTHEGFTDTFEVEIRAEAVYQAAVRSVTWQKGSEEDLNMTFHRTENDEVTFERFLFLEADGIVIPAGLYDALPGSLKLSVKPEYLETLSPGEHMLLAAFTDGDAQVRLTVHAKAPAPDPAFIQDRGSGYDFRFAFTVVWQGGREDGIEWDLYRPDGSAVPKKFNKKIVSENEWRYEAWFASGADYYIVERPLNGYMVRYENVGAHADVTDRCHNGGTIINYKVPRTGDDAAPAVWYGCALAGLTLLFLIIHAGKRKKDRDR